MIKETTTWPGWEPVRLLGSGGFGKVYEIRRETMGKTERAAVKVIRIPRDPSELQSVLNEGMNKKEATAFFRGFVEDITDEFDLMAKLTGLSNIVTCYDRDVIEDADGIGWTILIRMELLTPILSWYKEHPFSEEDVVRMGIDICRALEICQENHIIHRDIKPENIFINAHGDYKLGDFGIARTMDKTIASMSRKGTETYMAPEVVLGKKYGYSADIYSLSTVLYRFLNNNRTPFLPQDSIRFEDRENAICRKINGEKVPAPLNGSKKLKAVVVKGLAYEPEKRYSTAKKMRIALENCLLDYIKPVPRPVVEDEGTVRPIASRAVPVSPAPDRPLPDRELTEKTHTLSPCNPEREGTTIGPGIQKPPAPSGPKPKKWMILSGLLLLAALCAVILTRTNRKFHLEVIGGDGSGDYRKGEQIVLQTNETEEGYHFDHWESGEEIGDGADLYEETIDICMPGKDLTVTAVYDVNVNQVTVNGGEGSGEYAFGDIVWITADPAGENRVFSKWDTENEQLEIADETSAETMFVMPADRVEVTAEYEEETESAEEEIDSAEEEIDSAVDSDENLLVEQELMQEFAFAEPATDYVSEIIGDYHENVLMKYHGAKGELQGYRGTPNPRDLVFGVESWKRSEIQSVYVLDSLKEKPEDAVDLSAAKNGSVWGWVDASGNLYIAGNGGVMGPEDGEALFAYLPNCKTIDFGGNLHTDNTRRMDFMFYHCENLEYLNLDGISTEHVEDMSHMFTGCKTLKDIDLSLFNTTSATDFFAMFAWCTGLTDLDLTMFNSANVTNMSYMFYHCENLGSISWLWQNMATGNVLEMRSMFNSCYSLRYIDMSFFDMGNVRSTNYMFAECYNLVNLDTSQWKFYSIEEHEGMFDKSSYEEIFGVNGELLFA